MWQSRITRLDKGKITRVMLFDDNNGQLNYAKVMNLLREDGSFRACFNAEIASVSYPAFFWETPPVTASTTLRAFEFVAVDSPALAGVVADSSVFSDYYAADSQGAGIVSFPNLDRDATLVVPCPRGALSVYPHIGAFVRKASPDQQQALWRTVGEALVSTLNRNPVWLSTAGLGVYWLHIRLDSHPKYYSYGPYRDSV
mgnify:CR=1 FL=1